MPTRVVIIDRAGVITDSIMKSTTEDALYKKAGFKKDTNFCTAFSYQNADTHVHIYGKTIGTADKRNGFRFAAPFENIEFFGGIIATMTSAVTGEYLPLTATDFFTQLNKSTPVAAVGAIKTTVPPPTTTAPVVAPRKRKTSNATSQKEPVQENISESNTLEYQCELQMEEYE